MNAIVAWLLGLCPRCGSRTRPYTIHLADGRADYDSVKRGVVCDGCAYRKTTG